MDSLPNLDPDTQAALKAGLVAMTDYRARLAQQLAKEFQIAGIGYVQGSISHLAWMQRSTDIWCVAAEHHLTDVVMAHLLRGRS